MNRRQHTVSRDLESGISGIAFTLGYPVEKPRLRDREAHRSGPIVPDDAMVVWNVFPGQNDYAGQTGLVRLALSNAEPWEKSNGVLAEFELDIKDGADLGDAELKLAEVELTPTSYDNRMLSDVALAVGIREPPSAPVLRSITAEPFNIRFDTEPSRTYSVEESADLMAWKVVEQFKSTKRSHQFSDPRDDKFRHQYYRVQVE